MIRKRRPHRALETPETSETPKPTRSTTPAWRLARVVKYLSFCVAAIISVFYPSVIISTTFASFTPLAYAWSGIFFVGSAACLAGTLTKTWVGEFIGLSGVIVGLALYCLGVFADWPGLTWQRAFLGLIFLGFTMSSVARRQDVALQRRHADYERRLVSGKPGV